MATEDTYTYSENSHEAMLRLTSFLKDLLQQKKSIPFTTFMESALYHPHLGYYTRGHENVGKTGDFFTSVSVGSCFGIILAHRIHREWQRLNMPKSFHLIELGANNGQLAKDILDTIQSSFPALYSSTQYHIIEKLPNVIDLQRKTLSSHDLLLQHHSSPSHIGETGVILSNELIDAFPVHLLEYTNNQWHERSVTTDPQGDFTFHTAPLHSELKDSISAESPSLFTTLPSPPQQYQTEYRPALNHLSSSLHQILDHSLLITIDYGHTTSSYYAPSRQTGTLRCYHKHQADEDPLKLPGLKDITAHVDFTQWGNTLRNSNFRLTHFSSQSHYLTTQAKDWLTTMEQSGDIDLKLIRQFQTLTHPTTMGHQFHVLEAHTHLPEDSDTLEKLEITE